MMHGSMNIMMCIMMHGSMNVKFISSSQQKFSSIIYYRCADTAAIRTTTETARDNRISCQHCRRKLENVSKLIINFKLKLKLNLSSESIKKIKNCKSLI